MIVVCVVLYQSWFFCFFSSRRRHTRCALVTGVQTCALPILVEGGVRNVAAAELGRTGWGTVGLEEAVLADPDLLVLSFFDDQALSVTQRIRFHSAFRALQARKPAVTIEGRGWICPGWFLILAIEDLAAGVGQIGRAHV